MSRTAPSCPAAQLSPLRVGRHTLKSPVLLAPMSGITDLPFRRCVASLGAGLVVSEMVASAQLVSERHGALRRAEGRELEPFVIQLCGCEERWMGEGARIAQGLGAAIIDINMGCPAREVTGKRAGSALMRELDNAVRLIAAVKGSVSLPVTLKMRTGWDADSRNGPELARRAEAAGVALISVHARTRCQFFTGAPDWPFVRRVKDAVRIPVVINGDIVDPESARAALSASGADGVMIGRGALGRPWLPARVAAFLEGGRDPGAPTLACQKAIAVSHVESMLSYLGVARGLRAARKHIGWYLEAALERTSRSAELVRAWRASLLRGEDAKGVLAGLSEFYSQVPEIAR